MAAPALTTVPQPWDRQDQESEQAYAGFHAWLLSAWPRGEHGWFKPRRLDTVALTTGIPVTKLSRWRATWKWDDRARQYDRMIQARIGSAQGSFAQHCEKEQKERIRAMQDLCALELRKIVRDAETADSPTLNPRELRQLLAEVWKQERVFTDQPSDIKQDQGGIDLDKLSLEELELLDRLRKKAVPDQ